MGRRSNTQKAGWGTRFAHAVADYIDGVGAEMVERTGARIDALDAQDLYRRDRETCIALAWRYPDIANLAWRCAGLAGEPSGKWSDPGTAQAGAQVSAYVAELRSRAGISDDQYRKLREDAEAGSDKYTDTSLADLNRTLAGIGADLGVSLCRVADGLRRFAAAGSVRSDLEGCRGEGDPSGVTEDQPGRFGDDAWTASGGPESVETPKRTAPRDFPSDPESRGE